MEIIFLVRKRESYFIFFLIMSCLFLFRFLRDFVVFWLSLLGEVKIYGFRGRYFFEIVRDSVFGLICFIL